MTIRYLLIAGDSLERREQIVEPIAAIEKLSVVQPSERLTVLANNVLTMPKVTSPLVIGDIFVDSSPVDTGISGIDQLLKCPSSLVDGCWGRYVAVWFDRAETVCVLRDPSGALPCYYRSVEGLTFVASDIELLKRVTPFARRLNWTEIARILGAGDLRSPATGLSEISELPAGDLLSISPDRHRVSSVWTPAAFAIHASSEDVEAQAARLRAAIDRVICALGRSYPSALATVSGGLDSSIVALALAPVVRQLTCLTVATEDPSGDERRYARLIANAAPADYREAFFARSDVDLLRSQAAHLPRPTGRPFMQSLARIIADAAASAGASAVFNGSGGDNVFCFLQSATPVADRVLAQGMLRALPTLRDIAVMSHASYGEVLAATWRRLRPRDRRYRWRNDARFLASAARDAARSFDHPWLDLPAGSRLGAAVHIAMLLRTQNYLDPWRSGDTYEAINPLLAQPIVEVCLAIPSWTWCSGGADRAVARIAYADRLPAAVRSRAWKGGPEGFIGRLAEDNRPLIQARLLDGELAAQGIIDREAVATLLDQPKSLSSADALRLLNLCDAEAWVREMS